MVPSRPFFSGSRLSGVERLKLALLVERQNDRVGGRIDIEPDHVAQLLDEHRIVRELELAHAVRPPPWARQMRGTELTLIPTRRAIIAAVQWEAPTGGSVSINATTRSATSSSSEAMREDRRVAQQAIDLFVGRALLPSPDAGLRLARPSHQLDYADTGGAEQDDLGSPDILLGSVAVADQRIQAAVIRGRNLNGDIGAHVYGLASQRVRGNP